MRAIAILIFSILISGVGDFAESQISPKGFDKSPIQYPDSCISYRFEIVSLPYSELPHTGSLKIARDTGFTRDYDGVSMVEMNGLLYYHPVDLLNRTLAYLDAFRSGGDSVYLEKARRFLRRLFVESNEIDGALFYPYRFDYHVNQQEEGLLKAPWYSGMAQGLALSALTRMFEITGDSLYFDYCRRTFRSLLRKKGKDMPWVTFRDDTGCLWIDEYPLTPPSRTLNGFIFAIFGLYDFYRLTADSAARQMLQESLSTVKNYLLLFRRPGRPSFYGLRFGHYAANYHALHIRQLQYLHKMTGDSFFRVWADSLYHDYNETKQKE